MDAGLVQQGLLYATSPVEGKCTVLLLQPSAAISPAGCHQCRVQAAGSARSLRPAHDRRKRPGGGCTGHGLGRTAGGYDSAQHGVPREATMRSASTTTTQNH
jgi:hypothetical protein